MLKPPHGRNPQDRLTENILRQARVPGAPSRLSGAGSRDASVFPAAVPGAGTEAEGFLGFAFGFSGFGGPDWLMPSSEQRVVGRSLTPELN